MDIVGNAGKDGVGPVWHQCEIFSFFFLGSRFWLCYSWGNSYLYPMKPHLKKEPCILLWPFSCQIGFDVAPSCPRKFIFQPSRIPPVFFRVSSLTWRVSSGPVLRENLESCNYSAIFLHSFIIHHFLLLLLLALSEDWSVVLGSFNFWEFDWVRETWGL